MEYKAVRLPPARIWGSESTLCGSWRSTAIPKVEYKAPLGTAVIERTTLLRVMSLLSPYHHMSHPRHSLSYGGMEISDVVKRARRDEAAGFSNTPARMPFITTSNADKADLVTRKLIRSHVMRGKKSIKLRCAHPQNPSCLTATGPVEAPRWRGEEVLALYSSCLPERIGSDLSLIAANAEQSMLRNMMRGLSLLLLPRKWPDLTSFQSQQLP